MADEPPNRRTPLRRQTQRARALRADETDAEAALWFELRARRLYGFKFRRQMPIDRYIADFVCVDRKLIVELDGSQHAGSDYDRTRDRVLASHGYRTLRFWNHELLKEREWVLERIVEVLEGRE